MLWCTTWSTSVTSKLFTLHTTHIFNTKADNFTEHFSSKSQIKPFTPSKITARSTFPSTQNWTIQTPFWLANQSDQFSTHVFIPTFDILWNLIFGKWFPELIGHRNFTPWIKCVKSANDRIFGFIFPHLSFSTCLTVAAFSNWNRHWIYQCPYYAQTIRFSLPKPKPFPFHITVWMSGISSE